jgi:choline dehydrogenase-like flavoprotein
MLFMGFGECLPRYENAMALSKKVDRFGIPQVKFQFSWSANEREMRKDMAEQAQAMLKTAGAKHTFASPESDKPGSGIHEMGTARMGNDPSESVLNRYNQAHDVANLFVTDGSCMASSACVNPSLTYMALTARAADYAVKQLQSGKI